MKKNYTLLLMLMVCLNSFAATIYVNKNATGANNGSSWTNAYTTIELAFGNSIVGDQIWIAGGVYKPAGTARTTSYNIPNGVAVYGSFAGTETTLAQRDLSAGLTTTLNGDINTVGVSTDNCYTVVRFTNVSSLTIFDGFKIINGYNNSSTYGGAIYNSGGQPTIRNCEMIANFASRGGAVGNSTGDSSITTLISCKIRNNSATDGGGVFNNGGTLKLINCDITSNTASYGGGIHVEFDTVIIDRSILSGNSASNAGGVMYLDNTASNTEIYNSLLVGNFANEESVLGMNSAYSNPKFSKIVGSTIVNNRNTGTNPNTSWIITLPYSGASFHNNIMSHNIAPRVLLNGAVINCIIDAPYLAGSSSNVTSVAPTYVAANIAAAAPFAHDDYNYRLVTGSPGVDSGSNTLVNPLYTLDLAGNARINNSTVDIGAYESSALGLNEYVSNGRKTALYPNPTDQFVTIQATESMDYKLFNATGIAVQTGNINETNRTIDLSNYTSGMYYLQLSNGDTHKIMRK